MTHELIRRETSYSRMMMSERMAYANMMAGAGDLIPRGLFDNATGRPSPAKVFLVFETGSMLGLEPMAALQGIDVIEGSATLAPRLVLALIRAAGYRVVEQQLGRSIAEDGPGFGWSVSVYDDEVDPSSPMQAGSFTLADAVRADLCTLQRNGETWTVVALSERGKPKPWQQYPSDMTFWRAVGRVARRGFSHITLGIAYMPEELTSGVVGEDGTRELSSAESDDLIAELRKLHDRAELREWWATHRDDDACTPQVRNALDAHLLTVTRDSAAERRAGAPGNTGIAELDEQHPTDAEDREPETVDAEVEPDVDTEAHEHDDAVGEDVGDDEAWTGGPCPVCGRKHDASVHDAAETVDA